MSIKRVLCLFGRHSPVKETLKLAPEDEYDIWGKQAVYCGRCRKILYIGYFPPEHPNCRCVIVDPEVVETEDESGKTLLQKMKEKENSRSFRLNLFVWLVQRILVGDRTRPRDPDAGQKKRGRRNGKKNEQGL